MTLTGPTAAPGREQCGALAVVDNVLVSAQGFLPLACADGGGFPHVSEAAPNFIPRVDDAPVLPGARASRAMLRFPARSLPPLVGFGLRAAGLSESRSRAAVSLATRRPAMSPMGFQVLSASMSQQWSRPMPDTGEKPSPLEGKMPAVLEAGNFLRAFPRHADQSKPAWMRAAARFFGLTFAQAKKLYYGEVKTIDADTFLRMRSRLDELNKAQIKRQEILNDAAILLATVRNDARRTADAARQASGSGDGGRVRRAGR